MCNQTDERCDMVFPSTPPPLKGQIYADRETGKRIKILGPGITVYCLPCGLRRTSVLYPVQREDSRGFSALTVLGDYACVSFDEFDSIYTLVTFTEGEG